jgi:hypothetical protein
VRRRRSPIRRTAGRWPPASVARGRRPAAAKGGKTRALLRLSPPLLRVRRMCGDRSCLLLSTVRPSAADPARTSTTAPRRRLSRLVADAFGAPVLRDQGPIGRPGTARSMQASTNRPPAPKVSGRMRCADQRKRR